MVCLAVYVSTKEKNGTAKLILIYIIVFAFFISGYEHSVANFALFSLSLMHAHPDTITLSGAIANLIPTTLGNLIGGGVMVGYVYSKLHRNDKDCYTQ
jgi:nitrite transporter NirC